MSAGASTAAPKARAPALVVIPKSPTIALPPSSLTTTFSMTRLTGWSSLVIVQVTVGSPAARVTLPASKAPPPPLVQVQAVGVVAGERELGQGVRAGRDRERRGGVGEGVGGRLDGGRRTRAPPAPVVIPKSPTTALPPSSLTTRFSMTRLDRAAVFVNVQVEGVPGVDDRAHGGVTRIEARRGPLGEGAAAAGADRDHGTVRGAGDVRERPAGLGRLHDVLGAELERR